MQVATYTRADGVEIEITEVQGYYNVWEGDPPYQLLVQYGLDAHDIIRYLANALHNANHLAMKSNRRSA